MDVIVVSCSNHQFWLWCSLVLPLLPLSRPTSRCHAGLSWRVQGKIWLHGFHSTHFQLLWLPVKIWLMLAVFYSFTCNTGLGWVSCWLHAVRTQSHVGKQMQKQSDSMLTRLWKPLLFVSFAYICLFHLYILFCSSLVCELRLLTLLKCSLGHDWFQWICRLFGNGIFDFTFPILRDPRG